MNHHRLGISLGMLGLVLTAVQGSYAATSAASVVNQPVTARNSENGLVIDRSEAFAALAIIDSLSKGIEPSPSQWQDLWQSAGFRRLEEREQSYNPAFSRSGFETYLRSPATIAARDRIAAGIERWDEVSLSDARTKALAYLPAGTELRATIYPVIKPRDNEFVWDLQGNPAVFLLAAADIPPEKAENTMTHEMHHIGFGGSCPAPPETGNAPIDTLLGWVPAFGEGLAMLAASGGPDIHPHAVSSEEQRAIWDQNDAQFEKFLAEQNDFFTAVLDGSAGDDAQITQKMRSYYGEQGPWYTVGWRMAVTIERELGRQRLIESFCQPRLLLGAYNEASRHAARDGKDPLPQWDTRLVTALRVGSAE